MKESENFICCIPCGLRIFVDQTMFVTLADKYFGLQLDIKGKNR